MWGVVGTGGGEGVGATTMRRFGRPRMQVHANAFRGSRCTSVCWRGGGEEGEEASPVSETRTAREHTVTRTRITQCFFFSVGVTCCARATTVGAMGVEGVRAWSSAHGWAPFSCFRRAMPGTGGGWLRRRLRLPWGGGRHEGDAATAGTHMRADSAAGSTHSRDVKNLATPVKVDIFSRLHAAAHRPPIGRRCSMPRSGGHPTLVQ